MKKYLVLIFCILFSLSLFAFGRGRSIEITGLVRLVGNEPFPELSIYSKTDDREYVFEKKYFDEYRKYDGRVITIKATVVEKTLVLADGSKKFKRYDIIDSKFIK